MLNIIYRSLVATFALAFILCGVYPLFVTLCGRVLFPNHVNGGIIMKDGKPIGAKLIGQSFTRPEYFHGRPSAAGSGNGYDAANSGGSNLGPTSQKFADQLKANIDQVLKENPTLKKGKVPTDLVTASGSGLDPHLSPQAAYVQVDRIARLRQMDPDEIQKMIQSHVEGPQWGVFGEPVVNILLLNLELDKVHPMNAAVSNLQASFSH